MDTAPHQGWGNIVVADASAPSGDQLTITELFSGVSYNRSATTMRTTGACTWRCLAHAIMYLTRCLVTFLRSHCWRERVGSANLHVLVSDAWLLRALLAVCAARCDAKGYSCRSGVLYDSTRQQLHLLHTSRMPRFSLTLALPNDFHRVVHAVPLKQLLQLLATHCRRRALLRLWRAIARGRHLHSVVARHRPLTH